MPSDQNKISFVEQLHNFVRTKSQDTFQNVAKGIPGHVSKILANDFVEFTFDATSSVFTLPKIQIPQAFSKYHREPTQVGDKGIASPIDYSIAGPSGNDGSTATLYPRGNLTTLTFHPISNKNWPTKDPNMFLVTGGPSGHTIQSQDGKTTKIIDAINNILHTSSNNIAHQAAQAITHIAQQTITHASLSNGIINLVQKTLTIGAPSSNEVTLDATGVPVPPIPSLPAIVNLIGSLSASGSISATGGIAGGSGGGSVPVGSVGEVISSNNTAGVNLSNGVVANITTITLTPGDWNVQGEVWINGTSLNSSAFVAGFNTTNALPPAPNIATSRSQIQGTFIGTWCAPLRAGRANVTVNTTYYLNAQCNFTAGSAIANGNIWARRAA